MARHLFLVLTNPVDGQEDAYNDWYDNVHLDEVLGVPGFVGAQRFEVSAALPGSTQPPQQYLAIYEIESDDVAQSLRDLQAGVSSMTMSGALDRSSVNAFAVTTLGPRVATAGSDD